MPVVDRQADWVEASDKGASIFVGDIVSREQVAKDMGVSRATVYSWAKHREHTGFPEPIHGSEILGGGSAVYHWPTVISWHREYRVRKSKGGGHLQRANQRTSEHAQTLE